MSYVCERCGDPRTGCCGTLNALGLPIRHAVELLQERLADHRDRKSSDYNNCEDGPCEWCREAAVVIRALRGEVT